MTDDGIFKLWAKTNGKDGANWHPLILHMVDVAACAEAVLAREPEGTRNRMGACLGLEWRAASPWFKIAMACHDLGKACPGFQCKWPKVPATGLHTGRSIDTAVNHAFVSQMALAEWLQTRGWPEDSALLVADAVGSHHGSRATPSILFNLEGNARACGGRDWADARRFLADTLADLFKPERIPGKQGLSGPDFMLIAGLTSFADWIGSNEEWFPFGNPEDCKNLADWFQKRRARAERALDAVGWEPRAPLSPEPRSFERVFGVAPRPLQRATAHVLDAVDSPAILLLEAPMGEGKTEAAFFAHLELQRRFGHRGLYVALPTKATGNAMFARTLEFLQRLGAHRNIDLQLAHGASLLNDTFQDLRLSGVFDPATGGNIRAGEWFTHKKRALLSEYGVGTVDQAILPILPVRHNFVRLWGLSNRVLVFDEIHAYDAYTGTLLIHLLRWLLALGSSVVLLSATLPASTRRKLAGVVGAVLPEREAAYPRLTLLRHGSAVQEHFDPDPDRRLALQLRGIPADLPGIHSAVEGCLAEGGFALALVNTVQRAQELYGIFPAGEAMERKGRRVGKRLADGTEVFLFHARFPAEMRQERENAALEVFGQRGPRTGRKVLIATQVAEQSLDLDFDLIVTDLAPVDLLLQRAGRLWRHRRGARPLAEPVLMVAGLCGDAPPSFDKPLWWRSVYREDILLTTWVLLRGRDRLRLPDEIDFLVQAVYEEQVSMPQSLKERYENAMANAEGEASACKIQANRAIVGCPDDASWNDPSRYTLYDEDEPGVHKSLMALTRLGDDSAAAIPLRPEDGFDCGTAPDFHRAREWFLKSLSVSRKGVVEGLRAQGVPEAWRRSPLLRNCYPLELDGMGCWRIDSTVRLDDDLGLVFDDAKEV